MITKNRENIFFYLNHAAVQFEQGMYAYDFGCLDQAIQYVREACRLDRENTEFQIQLATLLTEKGKWEAAVNVLLNMSEQEQCTEICHLLFTICYAHMGEDELAKLYAESFAMTTSKVDYQPLNRSLKRRLLREMLMIAMEEIEQGTVKGLKKAVMLMERALKIDDGTLSISPLLAQAYLCIGDYETAECLLHHSLQKDKGNIQTLCTLIYVYQSWEKADKIEEYVGKLKNMIPIREQDRLKLGCVLASLGIYDSAFLCLKYVRQPKYRMRNSYAYWMNLCMDHLNETTQQSSCEFSS